MSTLRIIASILVVLGYGCGGKSKAKGDYPVHKGKIHAVGMIVALEEVDLPEWVDREGGTEEFEGKKHFWIKGMGQSKRRDIAKETAIKNAQARLAETMSIAVATQYAQAWESIGSEGDESIEEVKQGLIATKAKAEVGGLRLSESVKQQVAPVEEVGPDGSIKELGKAQWQYYVKMLLPYEDYIQYRQALKGKVEKSLNERQKELVKKADAALAQLDDNSNLSIK